MTQGPIFVISAPLAGAGRVADWLGQRTQIRTRWMIERSGPDWDRHSDRFRDATELWPQAIVRLGLGRLPRFEAHPSLALNVDFLARTFPKAQFLFLYRDVRENLARMLQAWDAQLHPHSSGVQINSGQRWCLTLPPGWSTLADRSVPEIVAWQWATTIHLALDALSDLPPERWAIAAFDRLLSEPEAEYQRLRTVLGLRPRPLVRALAAAGQVSPDPRLWQPCGERLQPVLHRVAEQADRAVRLFGKPPQTRVRR